MLIKRLNSLSYNWGIHGERIDNINFYWNQLLYATVNRGWLEHCENGQIQSIIAIDVDTPVKVENNNLLDCNFYCPFKNDIALYLHLPPSDLFESEANIIGLSSQFIQYYTVPLKGWYKKDEAGSKSLHHNLNVIIGQRFQKTKEGLEVDNFMQEMKRMGVILAEWQAEVIWNYIKERENGQETKHRENDYQANEGFHR